MTYTDDDTTQTATVVGWTAAERETTVNLDDGATHAIIWTAQRKFFNRLKAHPDVTLCREGVSPTGQPWGEFTIPADRYSPVSGIKRRSNMSPEAKAAAAARLKAARG